MEVLVIHLGPMKESDQNGQTRLHRYRLNPVALLEKVMPCMIGE
jgi:hypothetical protein